LPTSVEPFGIYVHWPFCRAKCPYCDFNSHVRHQPVNAMGFADAIARELTWFAGQTPGRTVSSLFFGGGTPSLMPPQAVAHVLDHVASKWPISPDCEITLEANPTSVEAENFRGYRTAGVNRVSVGVQSLIESDLKALGRQHTPEEALAAFRLAAQIFPRVSFDMIYARPHQTIAQWTDELSRALAEQQGHMSLYQLTIEPETAYFDLHAKGALNVPDDDLGAALYDVTQELTASHGLAAYEVSNHAAAGQESRHNLLYWRYGEYAGAGPGAHSRINGRALVMEKHPETWLKAVTAGANGLSGEEAISPAQQADEMLLMGLRLQEGIDLLRYERLKGTGIDAAKASELETLGLITRQGGKLTATQAGRRVLNAVIAELAA
jgi:putative oxygen-independent coproporphyrinogen III oxidase